MSNMICGRMYQVVMPTIKHTADRKRSRNRVLVEGLNKADGRPIRFKSTERAERHIRNMRLEK